MTSDEPSTIFVDDVSMWSSLSTATKQVPQPWKFDEAMIRDQAQKIFPGPITKVVFSSSLFDFSKERHYNPIINRSLRERHQLAMVTAMIEELYISLIKKQSPTFVIFTNHGNLCDTMKRCLQLGGRVHIVGVSGAVSTKLSGIQDPNFSYSYLPNVQVENRLCKWFMANGIPGKPVTSTSKWPQGCAAHLRGLCDKLHPDQIQWKYAVEVWKEQKPSDERNILKKHKDPPTTQQQRCQRGFYCKTFRTCQQFHSEAQWKYFQEHQKTPVLRKHVQCFKSHTQPNSQELCGFLHPNETRLCLWCNKQHEPSCYDSK